MGSFTPMMRQLPGQSGRPTGRPRPAQAARVNRPTAPTVTTKPVGRPPGAPGTNGWRAALQDLGAKSQTGRWNPGAQAAKAIVTNPAAASGMIQKASGTGANRNPEFLKAATGFLKAGAEMSPTQRASMGQALSGTDMPTPTPTATPGDGRPDAAAAPAPRGPASTPAPNAPAPAAGAAPVAAGGTVQPGAQAPAAPIATPETATSQPLQDSPWAYEQKWGALGALGDKDVDAATKAATLRNMEESPFGERARGVEAGRIAESGMLQARGAEQKMKAELARRGITGPDAARMIAEGNISARQGISQAQRKSALDMTKEEATYRLNATAQGQALSAELAKRGVDIETLRMNRENLAQQIKAQQARGGGGGAGENMIELMNPDGTTSQVPMDMLMMTLDLMEGGYE